MFLQKSKLGAKGLFHHDCPLDPLLDIELEEHTSKSLRSFFPLNEFCRLFILFRILIFNCALYQIIDLIRYLNEYHEFIPVLVSHSIQI